MSLSATTKKTGAGREGSPHSPPASPPSPVRAKKIGAPVPRSLRPVSPPSSTFRQQPQRATVGAVAPAKVSGPAGSSSSGAVTPSTAPLVAQPARALVQDSTSSSVARQGGASPTQRNVDSTNSLPRSAPPPTSSGGGGGTAAKGLHRGQSFGTPPQRLHTSGESTTKRSNAHDDDNDDNANDDDDDESAPRVFIMPTELQYVHRVASSASRSPSVPLQQQRQSSTTTKSQPYDMGPSEAAEWSVERSSGQRQISKVLPRRESSDAADRQYAAMRMEEYLVELLVEGRQDEYAQVKHNLDQQWAMMTMTSSGDVGGETLHSSPPRWPGNDVRSSAATQPPAPAAVEAAMPSEVYWRLVEEL